MVNVLSLFSGIGGLDLGLERAGMTIAGQVEIDPWCRTILAKHWPEVPRHDDVRTCPEWWQALADTERDGLERCEHAVTGQGARSGGRRLADPALAAGAAGDSTAGRPAVDVVCGGFPCQPVSHAGKRLAQADSRWLWPAFHSVIRHLRPRYVLVENVPGLLGRGMGDVLGDLAAIGYDAEWDCVPACFVGAPHIRDRVWIVAYSNGERTQQDSRGSGAAAYLGSADGTQWRLGSGPDIAGRSSDVADADGGGLRTDVRDILPGQSDTARRGTVVADAEGQRGELRQAQGQRPRRPPGSRNGILHPDASRIRCRDEPRVFRRQRPPQLGRRSTESRMGRSLDGLPAGMDRTAWRPGWEDGLPRVAHGVPRRVDRLRGLGNAVVPQVAEHIGRLIMEAAA